MLSEIDQSTHRSVAAEEGFVAMQGSGLDVSVVICAYTEDRWDDLVAAVESVRQQATPARETIVVVDHNSSLLARARATFVDARVIENSQTQGLSGARNSGIAAASSDVIAFLDDDGVAAPDWLTRLCAAYSDAAVVGVGGRIDPLWAQGRPGWFPEEFDWVVGCTYKGMPEQPMPVRNLIGCNMSFRRDVFAAVGGFHNGIGRVGTRPVGCEETELCIRVRQRWPQSVLLYDPRARVRHRVPSSRARWRYFRSRCYSEGLSKALVAREVGEQDALSNERAYTTRTLPLAVARGLAQAVTLREPADGLGQATCIVAGLTITAMGYIKGALTLRATGLAERRESILPWRS